MSHIPDSGKCSGFASQFIGVLGCLERLSKKGGGMNSHLKMLIIFALILMVISCETQCVNDIEIFYKLGGGNANYTIETVIDCSGNIKDEMTTLGDEGYSKAGIVPAEELFELHNLILDANVFDLENRYLCNENFPLDECPTDIPVTILTITIDNATKSITFDHYEPPADLKNIGDKIEEIRFSLK